jgi:hypothetical protein
MPRVQTDAMGCVSSRMSVGFIDTSSGTVKIVPGDTPAILKGSPVTVRV